MSPPDLDIQMEAERLTVIYFAKEMQEIQTARQLEMVMEPSPPDSNETRDSQRDVDQKSKKKKIK